MACCKHERQRKQWKLSHSWHSFGKNVRFVTSTVRVVKNKYTSVLQEYESYLCCYNTTASGSELSLITQLNASNKGVSLQEGLLPYGIDIVTAAAVWPLSLSHVIALHCRLYGSSFRDG